MLLCWMVKDYDNRVSGGLTPNNTHNIHCEIFCCIFRDLVSVWSILVYLSPFRNCIPEITIDSIHVMVEFVHFFKNHALGLHLYCNK